MIARTENIMVLSMGLERYRKKRDFSSTPEPKGGKTKKDIFCVQKHDATNLHYDFRLKVGSVLKSWAVPKGPSMDPSVKRLAIPTEDHPVDYAGFEGIIPEGEYGGGTVMLWDKGSFTNVSEKDGKKLSLKEAYEKGHISVDLDGERLKGVFALVRTGMDHNWLLIKKDDKHASKKDILKKSKSVKSGKTLKQIEKDAS